MRFLKGNIYFFPTSPVRKKKLAPRKKFFFFDHVLFNFKKTKIKIDKRKFTR